MYVGRDKGKTNIMHTLIKMEYIDQVNLNILWLANGFSQHLSVANKVSSSNRKLIRVEAHQDGMD